MQPTDRRRAAWRDHRPRQRLLLAACIDAASGGADQLVPVRGRAPADADIAYHEDEQAARIAADLEAVFDVPVQVSAVLGRSKMDVGELLKLGPGTVLELDRRVGEAIDIYVNNRLVARGEVVL